MNAELLLQIAGIAVVLGHTFPIFFGFKGGKGVATSLGVLLMSNWQIGLILFGICTNTNDFNKNGIIRFMCCSSFISGFNFIH